MRLVSGGWMWDGGSFGVGLLHCRVRGHLHSEDPPPLLPVMIFEPNKKGATFSRGGRFRFWVPRHGDNAALARRIISTLTLATSSSLFYTFFLKSPFFNKLFKFFCHFIPPRLKRASWLFENSEKIMTNHKEKHVMSYEHRAELWTKASRHKRRF